MDQVPFGIEVIGLLGLYGLVFLSIELLQAKHPIDSELARKSTHIIGGCLAASLPIFLERWQIVGLGVVMALAMGLSKRWNFFRSIHHVNRKGHGEIWFPLGVALLAIIEPTNDLRFISGVLVLGISDALASVIGIRYGRRKYFLVNRHWKTYLGSSVFFISTFVILASVFGTLAGAVFAEQAITYAAISLVLTTVEAGSHSGIDNGIIPAATALLLRLAKLS